MPVAACSTCGYVIDNTSEACPLCGTVLSAEPPDAGASVTAGVSEGARGAERGYDYDVFISFKSGGEGGNPTEENGIAARLHEYLLGEGFRVFFSAGEPAFQGRSQYANVIDKALESSQFMIVVGCSRENLESKLVKHEWSSFLNDIRSGFKPNGDAYVLYRGMKYADLPRALRNQRPIDMDEGEAFPKVRDFIRSALDRDGSALSPPRAKDEPPPEFESSRPETPGIKLSTPEPAYEGKKRLISVKAAAIALLLFALAVGVRDFRNSHIRNEEHRKVSTIINELTKMAEAAINYYERTERYAPSVEPLLPFITDQEFGSLVYLSHTTGDAGTWWVGLDLRAAGISESVRERLRRTEVIDRLYYAAPGMDFTRFAGQDAVWVRVRVH